MRLRSPFLPADLAELDERLLDRALAVVPMRAVNAGQTNPSLIAVRHDVDNAIEPAVEFAHWEAERGYTSTYFILHTAPYWDDKALLRRAVDEIASLGHEIGLHNNAIAASLLRGQDPVEILDEALGELRGYGHDVRGTVAHGDRLCYDERGAVRFVNDEIFEDCHRTEIGPVEREVGGYLTHRVSLEDFDLDYDANWIGPRWYLSDSGGTWRDPGFDAIADGFPFDRQVQMLIHPDWWGKAFAEVLV